MLLEDFRPPETLERSVIVAGLRSDSSPLGEGRDVWLIDTCDQPRAI